MHILFSYGEKIYALLVTIGDWIFYTPHQQWAENFIYALKVWLSMNPIAVKWPIEEFVIPILETIASSTIAELVLGPAIIFLLVYGLIKFFTDIIL